MSWLSKLTGIGISPKGVKIDPKKALMTALAVGTGVGGFGALTKLGTLGKIGAGAKVASSVVGGGGDDPGFVQGGNIAGADPGRFRQIGDFLKGNSRTIADLGSVGEGIYDRYQENKQYGDARKDYAAAAPLREVGMRGLLDTSRPDVSSLFADPNSPQGRYRTVNVGSRGRY
jgi:hypothetical protein